LAVAGALASATALASACTDVSTDPEEVVSLEFPPAPVPGVVVGDTLRDTTGAVASLVARAYNVRGDVIATTPITFMAVDPGVTIDAEGRVLGDSIRATPSRVVATTAGGLQSAARQIFVVLRPDTLRSLATTPDTIRPGSSRASRQSKAIEVRLVHDHAQQAADSAVQQYVVRYRITYPNVSPLDTTRAHLINENGRLAQADTTDANGKASLRVEIGPCGIEVQQDPRPTPSELCRAQITEPDRVEVEVNVTYRVGDEVFGSGLKIVIVVFPISF
jgi:hypothetical protein